MVSVSPGFLCTFVQPDATQNQLCALCFLNPDSAFALCLHFTGGLPYSGECVCFIWTHHWPSWPQIMLKEEWESRINLHHSRRKYLLRSVKAFANRGDPSRAFKMPHLSVVISITSKASQRVCGALIYPLAWETLPLLTQSSKRVRLWHSLIH